MRKRKIERQNSNNKSSKKDMDGMEVHYRPPRVSRTNKYITLEKVSMENLTYQNKTVGPILISFLGIDGLTYSLLENGNESSTT